MDHKQVNYERRVLLLIGFFAIIRLFAAFLIELGNDEAYYWLYSQQLQWNYFDHPPMVALWIRFFTGNLLLEHIPGFLRLGSIVSAAFATWFIYKASETIHSKKAGWLAALLLNASFYFGITVGLYIMPDSPQIFFWTFSLWMIARIMTDEKKWANWLLLGIAAGLCIMSKVHGVFIWTGLGMYVLFLRRKWLFLPQLYVAVLLTLVIASPILWWNMANDFVTYRFHSRRVKIEKLDLNYLSFVKELVHQVFFNNPLNTGLILWVVFRQQGWTSKKYPALTVFQFIGWPLAFILLCVALFRDTTLPHWSGPAFLTLLPVVAVYFADRTVQTAAPKICKWAVGLYIFVLTSWLAIIHFYPGTYGSKSSNNYGQGDISLDLVGWQKTSQFFDSLYRADVKNGVMPSNAALVTTYWWGAHSDYYLARPLGLQMIGLGDYPAIHHYAWLNRERIKKADIDNAYCIMPVDESYRLAIEEYQTIEEAARMEVKRSGQPAHYFIIYRLRGWKGRLTMAP